MKIKTKILLLIVMAGMVIGIGAVISRNASAISIVAVPTCSVPSAFYPTIQAAVSDAGCSTINVAPGTYNENVSIPRSLTLNGAKRGRDARGRSGPESIINGSGGANVTITANNVTVDGFTLNGPANSGTAAIVMQTGNTGETIQNNIVNNPGRAASFTTSNTVFRQNVVNNVFATATDGFQGNTTPVHNVTISDNNFSGANGNIYNADVTFIEGNSNLVVSGNKSTGDGTLVAVFKTNGAQITCNTVVGDGGSSAIYIGGGDSNITVSGNTVSSAGSAVNVANDFGVGTNSNVTITRNNLHNNKTGVKVGAPAIASAGTVVANRNNLTGNSLFGVNNLSSFTTDATRNWWGAANGPGPVGPGSGDKVSLNVAFTQWLHSPPSGGCGNNDDNGDNDDDHGGDGGHGDGDH